MRVNNFIEDYDAYSKSLNGRTSQVERFFYNEKIVEIGKDGKVKPSINSQKIKEIISLRGTRLMIAPAGSGKTFSLVNIGKELEKRILLVVPNKSQSQQIGVEYNIPYIVEGVKVEKKYGGEHKKEHNVYVCVYDKYLECIQHLDIDCVVIDEAHNLQIARYREKCLESIIDNLETINSVIYLTATPYSLSYLNFDEVVDFEKKEEYKYHNYSRLIKTTSKITDTIVNIIEENYRNGFRTLIRWNNIDETKNVINYFINKNYNCSFINSEEKETLKDEKGKTIRDEEGNVTYLNEFTNMIVNSSILPDSDIYFTTCILDNGINITGIDGEKDLSNLSIVNVITGPKDLCIDNMIQLEARGRKKYHEFVVITKETHDKEEEEMPAFKAMFKMYKRLLDNSIERYEEDIKIMKDCGLSNEEIFDELKTSLNYVDFDKISNTLNGSIEINEDLEININKRNFFYFVYKKYNEKIWYHIDEVAKLFDKMEIINGYTSPHINLDEVNFSKEIQKIKELQLLGFTEEESINMVGKNDNNGITKPLKLRDIEKIEINNVNNNIKNMNEEEYKEFIEVLNDYIENPLHHRHLEKENINVYILRNLGYIQDFKNAIEKDYNLETLLKEVESVDDIDKVLKQNQYIENNRRYKEGRRLVGNGKEQQIIIETFGNFNKTISLSKKKEILAALDKKDTKKNLKRLDELMFYIFKFNNKGQVIGLNGVD